MFFGKRPMDMGFAAELAIVTFAIVLGLRIPVLNLVALGLCVWMILIERSLDHILDLVFYLIPFSPIFKFNLDGFALFNIVTIVVLFRLMMANGWAFCFPGMSVILAIIYVFAGLRNAALPDCIRFVCQILIGALVVCEPRFRESLSVKRKNTMMVMGILGSSLIGLLRQLFPVIANLYEKGGARIKLGPGSYYYRFMGIEINPNMYTVLLSIAIAVYMVYLIKGRINKVDTTLMFLLLILGAMTVSMSFILSVIIIVALAFPALARRNPRITIYAVVVGVVGAIAVVALFGDSEAFQTILFRFQEGSEESADISSVTTGRSDIWMQYFRYFMQHPSVLIFGQGLNAKLPFRPPHNYYIETVYYLGIVGSVLYAIAHAVVYGPSRYAYRRCELYQHLPLIMLLIRGMARCLICNEKMLCIFLIYALAAIDTSDGQAIEARRS